MPYTHRPSPHYKHTTLHKKKKTKKKKNNYIFIYKHPYHRPPNTLGSRPNSESLQAFNAARVAQRWAYSKVNPP
jgi:hypothetical protein